MASLMRDAATGPMKPNHSEAVARSGSGRPKIFQPPDWLWKGFGPIGWWVRPGWAETLLGPHGLRLEEWQAQDRVRTIKSGPHRDVHRADLPGGPVYIKHYKVPSYREMWRQWIRRGKGRNEAKRAVRLASVGVATISPVALGEQRFRKFLFENYLISPEIPDSMPLDRFIETRMPVLSPLDAGRLRRDLAVALARLTARLHEAGVEHLDFHPGNVLVRSKPDGALELAMIDLDALRFRRRVRWSRARWNLALLDHSIGSRGSRSDRLRFLRAYLRERGASGPIDLGRLAREIGQESRRWAERLWTRCGRRCRSTNKYFYTRDVPGGWAVASRALDPARVVEILRDPDQIFRLPGTVILKDSRTTTVAETTLPVAGQMVPVIFKRFNRKKKLDPWLALFRPSRGWRAWQAGQHLTSRGIPTPENLLYIRRTSAPGKSSRMTFLPRDTYLVTLKAAPATTLGDYARGPLAAKTPAEQKQARRCYARALGLLIRQLHARSLSHRDLKAANILVEGDPDAIWPQLSLIDLVGVSLRHPTPATRIIQNLARLHLSLADAPGRTRTDTLRFLRSYLPWAYTPRSEWKAVWRKVDRAAGRKTAQNQHRGRPLS